MVISELGSVQTLELESANNSPPAKRIETEGSLDLMEAMMEDLDEQHNVLEESSLNEIDKVSYLIILLLLINFLFRNWTITSKKRVYLTS